MRIAREGYSMISAAAGLAIAAGVFGCGRLAGLLALAAAAMAGFFRDPERVIPEGEGLIVSPADGKVVSIVPRNDADPVAEGGSRISIFLSPLDVHINRMPVSGTVEQTRYRRGKFFAAYKDEATDRNEQNMLRIVEPGGRRLAVVQVAGALARRIVCHAQAGDTFKRGDRFGLIMFGSRTDTYLPPGCSVEVVEGQRVKGGETILGRLT